MNFNFLISFFIGLGVYLLVLGIITIVKHIRNKKKVDKEINQNKYEHNESNE